MALPDTWNTIIAVTPIYHVEHISPQLAEQYLATQLHNRPLKQSTLTEYTQAMLRGEWVLTHQGIAFDTNGHLIDGQHRLLAVLRSGVTIESLVVRDVRSATFDVVDRGVKRTAGDVLAMIGYPYSNQLAGAISWKYRYDHKHLAYRDTPTPRQVEQILLDHPLLPQCVEEANQLLKPRSLASPALVTWIYYEITRRDVGLARSFAEEAWSGLALLPETTTLTLRTMLEHERSSVARRPLGVIAILHMKAWNAYIAGQQLKLLRFNPKEQIDFQRP